MHGKRRIAEGCTVDEFPKTPEDREASNETPDLKTPPSVSTLVVPVVSPYCSKAPIAQNSPKPYWSPRESHAVPIMFGQTSVANPRFRPPIPLEEPSTKTHHRQTPMCAGTGEVQSQCFLTQVVQIRPTRNLPRCNLLPSGSFRSSKLDAREESHRRRLN